MQDPKKQRKRQLSKLGEQLEGDFPEHIHLKARHRQRRLRKLGYKKLRTAA